MSDIDPSANGIEAGVIPVVMMVREGAVIPRIALAQSTSQMDWSKLELVVFATSSSQVTGKVCLPSDNILHSLTLTGENASYNLDKDPLAGRVKWNIHLYK